MSGLRRVPCELLGARVTIPRRPQRVVVLVSGWTETLWDMGLADRVVGVSTFCRRYVDVGDRAVVGSYLEVDDAILRSVQPDLVLLTAGVQLGVARKLAAAGWPVMVLPLPESLPEVVANVRRLGAVMGEMERAHRLEQQMLAAAARCCATEFTRRPRVYAELWFGRHVRMAGALTLVHDLITLAGGDNVMAAEPEGYMRLDLEQVRARRPDVAVVFWEEDDHVIDVHRLWHERGWPQNWPGRRIEAGIPRGRNLIHDGPSLFETVAWLRSQLLVVDAAAVRSS